MNNPHVDFDYFSFTFCPSELVSIRQMAAHSPLSFPDYLKTHVDTDDFQAAIEHHISVEQIHNTYQLQAELSEGQVIDVDWLQDRCVSQLLNFCSTATRQFFDNRQDVTDAWDEYFSVRCRGMGMFGYRRSWDLYLDKTHIGVAAAGATNGGCYISFSGAGCGLIDFRKLHDAIRRLPLIKITRADFAFDDYQGNNSVDYAQKRWFEGGFKLKGAGSNPTCDMFSSGGKRVPIPSSESSEWGVFYAGGRTFQVGSRKNGKLIRIYEKGKQLGTPDSKWVRWEVELRSKDREIPLQVMLDPDSYFVSFYPVLSELVVVEQPSRIKTQRRKVAVAYENSVAAAKRTYGAIINVMREAKQLTDSQIVQQLISTDPAAVPRPLRLAYGAGIST